MELNVTSGLTHILSETCTLLVDSPQFPMIEVHRGYEQLSCREKDQGMFNAEKSDTFPATIVVF